MNIQINPFTLEGCQCRVKFDPKELQRLLHEELAKKAEKQNKRLNSTDGELLINGAFTEIDEGNFALHLMLAFLGKARLVCRASASIDGQILLDEELNASATCAAFSPPRSQLKYDTRLIADQVIKKTIKALGNRRTNE